MYFAADAIRAAASQVTGTSSIFLYLFMLAPKVGDAQVQLPSAWEFVAIVGPLLGIVFAFDAVNGERAAGTLPRLLSQPIFRDDVINGKFAAGLSVIGLVLRSWSSLISAFGIIRLGIVPDAQRDPADRHVADPHVDLRLALAGLRAASVGADPARGDVGARRLRDVGLPDVLRRPDHRPGRRLPAPRSRAPDRQQASNLALQQTITRLLPDTLYREGSLVDPQPAGRGGDEPGDDRRATSRPRSGSRRSSPTESLLLVWPHVVILLALTSGLSRSPMSASCAKRSRA